MRCLICLTPDHARPGKNGSDFEALFGGLVRGMPDYHWAIDSGNYAPWAWPYGEWSEKVIESIEDSVVYHEVSEHRGNYAVVGTTFMVKYMKYLIDDWKDIHAFASEPVSFTHTRYWSAPYLSQAVAMPERATHAFINTDGCHWAMLTECEDDIRKVAAGWNNTKLYDADLVEVD